MKNGVGKFKEGRPSKYTPELAEKLCETIAMSTEGLKKICDANPEFPSYRTVFDWLSNPEKYPEFSQLYARGREGQADLLADEIIEISNTPVIGTKRVSKPTGEEITEGDMIEHRRLQVDARKWKASKLAPRKYGDKIEVEGGGTTINQMIIITRDEQTKDELKNLR